MLSEVWTWVAGSSTADQLTTDEAPGARRSPSLIASSFDNMLYLLGGYGYTTSSEDRLSGLWKFNPLNSTFSFLKGDSTSLSYGNCSSLGHFAAGLFPPAGTARYSGFDSEGNLYFGGGWGQTCSGSVGYIGMLWKLTIPSLTFGWVAGSSLVNAAFTRLKCWRNLGFQSGL